MKSKREAAIRTVCDRQKQNLKYIRQEVAKTQEQGNESWLLKTLIPTRYEDLSSNITLWTNKIYSHINSTKGLTSILKELQQITTTKSKTQQSNPYSTKRNSKKILFSWKRNLKFEEVQMIQDSCGREYFRLFGYRWYEDEEMYYSEMQDIESVEKEEQKQKETPLLQNWFYDIDKKEFKF